MVNASQESSNETNYTFISIYMGLYSWQVYGAYNYAQRVSVYVENEIISKLR